MSQPVDADDMLALEDLPGGRVTLNGGPIYDEDWDADEDEDWDADEDEDWDDGFDGIDI